MLKLLLLLMFFFPTFVTADCAAYNLNEYKLAPIFIRGVVVSTTPESQLKGCSQDSPCRYSFSVAVSEVIKGRVSSQKLFFSYGFHSNICPPDLTFTNGDEWIFALKSVDLEGNAKLYGGACGGYGIPTKYEGAVKELMSILEIKRNPVNNSILPSANSAGKF